MVKLGFAASDCPGGNVGFARFKGAKGDVLARRMEPIHDLVWEVDDGLPPERPNVLLLSDVQFKARFTTSLDYESQRMYHGHTPTYPPSYITQGKRVRRNPETGS